MTGFAELVAATNYSFLRGASSPRDMVATAVVLGLDAIGIADRNTVAGVVRAHVALKEMREKWSAARDKARIRHEADRPWETFPDAPPLPEPPPWFRLVVGARLVFRDGTPDIVAYPATRYGWGRLTRLLTVGNRRATKGGCLLDIGDLIAHHQDLLLIVMDENSFDSEEVAELAEKRRIAEEHDRGFLQLGEEEAIDSNVVAFPKRLVEPTLASNDLPTTSVVVWPSRRVPDVEGLEATLRRLKRIVGDRLWLGTTMTHSGKDKRCLHELAKIASVANVPLLATNDALYASPDQRQLHDVVTCIRKGTDVKRAGRLLEANAERHLKPTAEMARLFCRHPQAIDETKCLLARIDFTLDQLGYEYPHEPVPEGWEAQDWLEHLVLEAAAKKYGETIPAKAKALIDEEFALIREREYAYYFLTVHDIVRFARSCEPPILCQGRGSAANSIVCWLLDVTSVDPVKHDLLFSRFVSSERDEPPDIDVDFEHERREEVMQYVYRRYGRHRAAIIATVIHYRSRSTLREVGKALGMSEDVTSRLSGTIWGSYSNTVEESRFAQAGFTLDNPEIGRLKELVDQLLEFPRHLSQHVGGFLLTQEPLVETVPLHNAAMEDRTFIEWDKDDIDALKLMKVDVLALGMLTCIKKAFDLIEQQKPERPELGTIATQEDPVIYDMLCQADSLGLFQVESRAQMSMLPRLRPEKFYDIVVQVAIVRPGPIQGNMVHPYLRRRAKKEKVRFPKPSPQFGPPDELESVLGKTEGVPLFQEQAMKLAIVAAEFSPDDANRLRRAMATFRNVGTIQNFETKMVEGMVRRGYERDFAQRCYDQIKGFGSYGFPESHALSFARLVYVSAWIKCYYPAVFACALLNSQPMGFYAPAQIVRDAYEHGVAILPIDVNASGWDNSLEISDLTPEPLPKWLKRDRHDNGLGLRLGFRQIDGFREDWANALAVARAETPFPSIEDLARRANLPSRALRLLADADAWGSIGKGRRDALWEVRRTPSSELPLFAAAKARELGVEEDAKLPAMPLSEEVSADYQLTRLSLKGHPMQFLRPVFDAEHVQTCDQVSGAKHGSRVTVAGVVLVRQRPGNGNAVFITLEDETGITNVLLWARVFEAQRMQVMGSRLMTVEGEVQRSAPSEGSVVHLIGARVIDRTHELARLSEDRETRPVMARADIGLVRDPRYVKATSTGGRHPRDVRILPKSRDFH
ncbi:DNA polymerase III subunit alpha [Sphingomonas panacisoli]|uniref:Error-prone DNA polymerase n=1 Tax=Sphingomonas panacisoli TaxID=1813879 RepID=A0A5B8LFQ0_9SPHN|nr:error-prone DNA polymerase [Sphingomonas panacisoli]QDZ07078.1 DNA polymerase III subunit alpha [Sphingomonas panacisoli]